MWGSGDTQNTLKLNFMHLWVVGMQKPSKFPKLPSASTSTPHEPPGETSTT